ncbi:hypothetical protein GCM10022293_29150 [Azospirillum formosense]
MRGAAGLPPQPQQAVPSLARAVIRQMPLAQIGMRVCRQDLRAIQQQAGGAQVIALPIGQAEIADAHLLQRKAPRQPLQESQRGDEVALVGAGHAQCRHG